MLKEEVKTVQSKEKRLQHRKLNQTFRFVQGVSSALLASGDKYYLLRCGKCCCLCSTNTSTRCIRRNQLRSDQMEFSSRYRLQIPNVTDFKCVIDGTLKPCSNFSFVGGGLMDIWWRLTGALCVARWPGSWEFLPSNRQWSGSVSMAAPVDRLSSRSQSLRSSSWDETSHPTAGCELTRTRSVCVCVLR